MKKNVSEHNKHSPLKKKTLLFLSGVLILLLCFGVTTAAMFSTTDGRSGTTAIAVFAFDAGNTTTGDLSINCNTGINAASYEFWVTNMENNQISDVTLSYIVQVNLSEALPSGLTMAIDGIAGTTSEDGLTYTFTNADEWVFENGIGKTTDHTLTFTAESDVVTADYAIPGISVKVIAEQID